MKDEADLLLMQNRLVQKLMERYESKQADEAKLEEIKRATFDRLIATGLEEVRSITNALDEQNKMIEELSIETARKQYQQLASILMEMIPLLADAIALRLQR